VKKFPVFLVAFCLAAFLNSPDRNAISARDVKNRATWRQKLLDSFCQLDLERIVRQDQKYLDSIGADYDEDNKRFFIEPHFSRMVRPIDNCFLFFDFRKPEEALITIYPPDSEPFIWLKARLRTSVESLNATIVFEPGLFYQDSINVKIPINKANLKTAGVIAEN